MDQALILSLNHCPAAQELLWQGLWVEGAQQDQMMVWSGEHHGGFCLSLEAYHVGTSTLLALYGVENSPRCLVGTRSLLGPQLAQLSFWWSPWTTCYGLVGGYCVFLVVARSVH